MKKPSLSCSTKDGEVFFSKHRYNYQSQTIRRSIPVHRPGHSKVAFEGFEFDLHYLM